MSLIESPLQVYGSQERSSASSVSPGALLIFKTDDSYSNRRAQTLTPRARIGDAADGSQRCCRRYASQAGTRVALVPRAGV